MMKGILDSVTEKDLRGFVMSSNKKIVDKIDILQKTT